MQQANIVDKIGPEIRRHTGRMETLFDLRSLVHVPHAKQLDKVQIGGIDGSVFRWRIRIFRRPRFLL